MTKRLITQLLVGVIVVIWPLFAGIAAAPAAARDRRREIDFGRLVKLIEAHYRVKSKGLPWAARMGMKAARPLTRLGGYGNVKVAFFEDQDFTSPAGGGDFGAAMRSALQPEWRPLVEVWTNKSSEQTYVYIREGGSGRFFKVLVVALGRRDGTAVQAELSEEKLAELLRDPERTGRAMTGETTSGTEPE